MIPCRVRRAALSGLVFANSKAKRLAIRLTRWTGTTSEHECKPEELGAELGKNGFRIEHLHPTDYNTPLIGAIDLVRGHSMPFYRRHTEIRRCLPRRYPGKNAGFSAVCGAT